MSTINLETIQIGGVRLTTRGSVKAPKLVVSYEHINADGYTDLIAFFSVPELVQANVLTETTTGLVLTANLNNGVTVEGMDTVNIVPP